MKTKLLYFLLLLSLCFTGCEMDLENPNAATESQVLSTKDGLYALASGIQTVYSTSALEPVIFTPSVTTRETAIMTTFANLEELEQGGPSLSGENGYTERLFTRLMRVKGMSEDLIGAVDNVDMSDQVRANLKAWGQLYRAISLGYLASNFEQVALVNGDDAVYSPRAAAYEEAISLLRDNVDLITSNGISAEFTSSVGSSLDLLNCSRLFLARYLLYTGMNTEAITVASAVDKSSMSVFKFDNQNRNPIYLGFFDGTISYAPRDDFGLPSSDFTIDSGDNRVNFFLGNTGNLSLNNLPISVAVSPFYATSTSSIPVYVPGEADLIIAEAYARSNNITQAETALNRIRKKQPANDVFGIGAGLSNTYSSGNNQAALLLEIYKNRRIELFLTGNSLEDSRRFGRVQGNDLSSERNRDFYPYPPDERLNNPNTPPNPTI